MEKTNPKDMFVSRNSQQPIEASLSHLQQPIDILLAQAFGDIETQKCGTGGVKAGQQTLPSAVLHLVKAV